VTGVKKCAFAILNGVWFLLTVVCFLLNVVCFI
jgi:hypothetical protein